LTHLEVGTDGSGRIRDDVAQSTERAFVEREQIEVVGWEMESRERRAPGEEHRLIHAREQSLENLALERAEPR